MQTRSMRKRKQQSTSLHECQPITSSIKEVYSEVAPEGIVCTPSQKIAKLEVRCEKPESTPPSKSAFSLDCSLCLSLLCEPVSIACGHTFCRICMLKSMQYSHQKCPICRVPCNLSGNTCNSTSISTKMPINILLQDIIRQVYPDEYASRLLEVKSESEYVPVNVPIFTIGKNALLPYQKACILLSQATAKSILEKYQQGDRCMGFITKNSPEFDMIGTGAEILSYETFRKGEKQLLSKEINLGSGEVEDGDVIFHVQGKFRFRINHFWGENCGGLLLRRATISYLHDIVPEVEDEEDGLFSGKYCHLGHVASSFTSCDGVLVQFKKFSSANSNVSLQTLMHCMRLYMRRLYETLGENKRIRFVDRYGEMPTTSTIEFSYWVANIFGVTPDNRDLMLEATSIRERIMLCLFKFEKIGRPSLQH